MKMLGVIVNIFLPGIGSLVVGQTTTGIVQFLLWLFGVILILTGILAIIGVPISIIAWIWSIITAANSPDKPA